jgi:hypothetical protein
MPRPLNWIRGEGTVKNQRWGLGDLNIYDPNFGTMEYDSATHSSIPMYNPAGGGMAEYAAWANPTGVTWPDWASPSTYYGANTVGSTTVGDWIKNNMLLIGVGLGAVLLLRRR